MASLPDGVAVAPELLDYINDYVEEVDVNDAVRGKEIDADSNLLVFCRELYVQLLAGTMDLTVTAIDSRNGAAMLAARTAVDESTWPDALRRLVDGFPAVCKMYPDLLGETYSSSESITDLHFLVVPALLTSLHEAAGVAGPKRLAEAAGRASRNYSAFLDNFVPGHDDGG